MLLIVSLGLVACSNANNNAPHTAVPAAAVSSRVSVTSTPAGSPPARITATASGTPAGAAPTARPAASATAAIAETSAAVSTSQPPGDPQGWGFEPATVIVRAGGTVTWINPAGREIHTVTADDGKSYDSGVLSAGDTFKQTFAAAGSFTYHCTLHAWMKGAVTVLP